MRIFKIEEIKNDKGEVKRIKIISQSHRGNKFSEQGSSFVASNGFILESQTCPESRPRKLYVRGDSHNLDKSFIRVISQDWLIRLKEAITEYLQYNNDCNHCIERKCNGCIINNVKEK